MVIESMNTMVRSLILILISSHSLIFLSAKFMHSIFWNDLNDFCAIIHVVGQKYMARNCSKEVKSPGKTVGSCRGQS